MYFNLSIRLPSKTVALYQRVQTQEMMKQEPKQDANITWGVASIELYCKWYTSYYMLAEAANEMLNTNEEAEIYKRRKQYKISNHS